MKRVIAEPKRKPAVQPIMEKPAHEASHSAAAMNFPSHTTSGRTITVDPEGFVRVDGVMLARRVFRDNGQVCLQLCDKDKRRSSQRGTRFLEITVQDLLNALETPAVEAQVLSSFCCD